jgi:hypothetical protein
LRRWTGSLDERRRWCGGIVRDERIRDGGRSLGSNENIPICILSMTVVQSEESVKIGLFFERYEKKFFRKYILSVQDAYQDACGVAVGRDAVRRFRVVSRRVRACFSGIDLRWRFLALSSCVAHRRHEHTGPTICDRFSPSRPKVQPDALTLDKAGETTTISGERHVAHIAARGVSGRALETNSATRRRVSPLQTTSVSPGAFSSSGAAGAHEAARPAPRAVDVDWLIRNTKRALTRRDGRRPRQHRLSEGSARGDHRDA